MSPRRHAARLLSTLTLIAVAAMAHAETPQQILATYVGAASQQAIGFAASATRGAEFFRSKHGREWSCSSCHTDDPTAAGKHVVTGKTIQPMAVSTNTERFTRPEKVEKWFTRNCKDVAGRECTPTEKADVIAYLSTVK